MPENVSSLIGGMKDLGASRDRADDSSPSLLNAPDQKTKGINVHRKGNVYVETDENGITKYYPAKHYDNGIMVSFPTEAEAIRANDMSEEELSGMQMQGQEEGQSLLPSPAMGRGGAGL